MDVDILHTRRLITLFLGILLTCILANVRYMSSPVRLSVVYLSVTFMHLTQAIEIFGNISTPFVTLSIH